MAPRKKPQAEKPAAKAAKPVTPPAPVKETKPVKKFIAVRTRVYHPFARVMIPTGPPGVILELPDSWLDCQIDRGLVKEL